MVDRCRSRWICAAALVSLALCAATALADGLPVLGVDAGPTGVTDLGETTRFVTMPSGPNTVVARVETEGGRISASRSLRGDLTIPAVAYDGSAGGLSADGSTLALIQPRRAFPRSRTRFELIATRTLRARSVIDLRGDFSFDAISPDGRFVYLVNYTSQTDPTRYRVRAYDARAGRLLPNPVIDPTEPDEQMRGTPMTRAMSPDGRWAYTLYQGFDGTPFIHALDTAGITARCIDLEKLAGQDVSAFRLDVDSSGGELDVRKGSQVMARVDLATFAASVPVRVGPAARSLPVRPWMVIAAGGLGGLIALGVRLMARHRRRPAANILRAGPNRG